MLGKKFQGRKNIYFEYAADEPLPKLQKESELVRSSGGANVYGVRCDSYHKASLVEKVLESPVAAVGYDGTHEIWG